ncbi:hypothetical protein [Reichenbachiella sp.]|uniref:hypothetical protein n=1 Tax=Reichenbachiella sp. TaxID=2184521 RepID=UPI003BB18509
MKKKDLKSENVNGCCTTNEAASNTNEICCDQPSDGSLCCDKSETKEVNAATTGCC